MPTKTERDEAADKLKAQSKSLDEAQEKKLDETVPGGRYLVNGVLVNADGEPVNDKKTKEK